MKPRYLLDEHVNPAIQRQLRRLIRELDARCVSDGDAPPKGTRDDDLLAWANANEFILITEDRRTMPGAIARRSELGEYTFGVFFIRPGACIGAVIEALELIWHTSAHNEFIDSALFIPL